MHYMLQFKELGGYLSGWTHLGLMCPLWFTRVDASTSIGFFKGEDLLRMRRNCMFLSCSASLSNPPILKFWNELWYWMRYNSMMDWNEAEIWIRTPLFCSCVTSDKLSSVCIICLICGMWVTLLACCFVLFCFNLMTTYELSRTVSDKCWSPLKGSC